MDVAVPNDVAAAYGRYPAPVRDGLLRIRQLIFDLAAEAETGPLTETLKWGEPAYLTKTSGSGTTIRLGVSKFTPDRCAVFFNCRTDLIAGFRDRFPKVFGFEGMRALILTADSAQSDVALAICLTEALTYHRCKRTQASQS